MAIPNQENYVHYRDPDEYERQQLLSQETNWSFEAQAASSTQSAISNSFNTGNAVAAGHLDNEDQQALNELYNISSLHPTNQYGIRTLETRAYIPKVAQGRHR